jgi:hypothetical protein
MKLFFLSSFLLIVACNVRVNPITQPVTFIDTSKTFKKEIPSINIFYKLAKAKEKQLGLDSIENGFNNLQVRIWYDFSLVRNRKLIVITNRDTNWNAILYDLQVDWDGRKETILSKNVKQLSPKSGWAFFSKELLALDIVTLPDQDDIKEYYGGKDGRTYNVEVATKNQYRFYGYWEPQEYRDRFWQARKMIDFLKLIEMELGVRYA